eukprot:1361571-Amorphochlora_amoeboformis.AAC.1
MSFYCIALFPALKRGHIERICNFARIVLRASQTIHRCPTLALDPPSPNPDPHFHQAKLIQPTLQVVRVFDLNEIGFETYGRRDRVLGRIDWLLQ